MPTRARLIPALAAACCAVALLLLATRAGASASFTPQCADPFPAARTAHNPLMLTPAPPASNPLAGASFFVAGPAHGPAAARSRSCSGSIPARRRRGAPVLPGQRVVAQFAKYVSSHEAGVSATVQQQILELEKIASEPETERISRYSAGGTPAGIYSQAQKLFCHNFTADPGTIPVITTYFLHATLGGCPPRRRSPATSRRSRPRSTRWRRRPATAPSSTCWSSMRSVPRPASPRRRPRSRTGSRCSSSRR